MRSFIIPFCRLMMQKRRKKPADHRGLSQHRNTAGYALLTQVESPALNMTSRKGFTYDIDFGGAIGYTKIDSL